MYYKAPYREMYQCYTQSGPWLDGSILPKHPREEDGQYTLRKSSFQSPSVYSHLIDTYDCLWARNPARDGADPLFNEHFVYDAGNGMALNEVINHTLKMGMVMGSCFLIMDTFAEQPDSIEQMVELRTYPFLEVIYPYQVTELYVDKVGRITRFGYKFVEDGIEYTRCIEDSKAIDTCSNDKTYCVIHELVHPMPVIAVNLSKESFKCDELPSSPTTSLYQQQKSIAITESYIDEEFVSSCFPLLVVKSDSPPANVVIGTQKGLHLGKEEDALWLQPSNVTIDSKLKRIEHTISMMVKTHANLISSGDAQSGVAKLLDRQVGASYLSKLATYMEKIEYKIYELWCVYSGATYNTEYKVTYSKDFNFTSIAEQIAIVTEMLNMDLSDETKLAIKRSLLEMVFSEDSEQLIALVQAESMNVPTAPTSVDQIEEPEVE